jgi:hypothetical protein
MPRLTTNRLEVLGTDLRAVCDMSAKATEHPADGAALRRVWSMKANSGLGNDTPRRRTLFTDTSYNAGLLTYTNPEAWTVCLQCTGG